MAAEKAGRAIDKAIDEARSFKNGITVDLQNFSEHMDKRFSSLDSRLLSVNQQIHSCLEEAKIINKYFTRFFDFVFNAAFMVIGFYFVLALIHMK